MAPILSCQHLVKEIGGHLLFSGLNLSFDKRARVGLIGRNGAGKSTLLKIFAGVEEADEGTVVRSRDVRLSLLKQTDTFPDPDASVQMFLESSFSVTDSSSPSVQARRALSLAGFDDPTSHIKTLSGGWKKRLSLARILAEEPDFLLLDEPSNHLDFAGLDWLDGLLNRFAGGFIVSSHDRALLNKHCTSIIEIAEWYPDGFFQVTGNYDEFVSQREALLAALTSQADSLSNKAARELEWLRAGVKARTTKASARKDAAARLIEEAQEARRRLSTKQKRASALSSLKSSDRRTKELIKLLDARYETPSRVLFSDVTLTLSPGQCMAVVGPNGSGKSTLLKVLAGQLQSERGSLTHAPNLKIAFFSQGRERLNPTSTLQASLCPEGDFVSLGDHRIHVTAWARQLGFSIQQLSTPVGSLSGGEQARVALSEVILTRADILLLDEPTNDLDISTLELLEEALAAFTGAVVLVSHDRYLLQTIPTMLLALDGEGGSSTFATYEQWRSAEYLHTDQQTSSSKTISEQKERESSRIRLSWQEKKELGSIEAEIERAETHLEKLQQALLDSDANQDSTKLQKLTAELSAYHDKIEHLFARWEELEEKRKAELASRETAKG